MEWQFNDENSTGIFSISLYFCPYWRSENIDHIDPIFFEANGGEASDSSPHYGKGKTNPFWKFIKRQNSTLRSFFHVASSRWSGATCTNECGISQHDAFSFRFWQPNFFSPEVWHVSSISDLWPSPQHEEKTHQKLPQLVYEEAPLDYRCQTI